MGDDRCARNLRKMRGRAVNQADAVSTQLGGPCVAVVEGIRRRIDDGGLVKCEAELFLGRSKNVVARFIQTANQR